MMENEKYIFDVHAVRIFDYSFDEETWKYFNFVDFNLFESALIK